MKRKRAIELAITILERRQLDYSSGHLQYLSGHNVSWTKEEHEHWLEIDESIEILKGIKAYESCTRSLAR